MNKREDTRFEEVRDREENIQNFLIKDSDYPY